MRPITIVCMIAGIILYFLPYFVAVKRRVQSVAAIFSLNLMLGWTVLGWVIALKWAFDAEKWF